MLLCKNVPHRYTTLNTDLSDIQLACRDLFAIACPARDGKQLPKIGRSGELRAIRCTGQ